MNGELFKRLIALDHGAWVISYDEPGAPQYHGCFPGGL